MFECHSVEPFGEDPNHEETLPEMIVKVQHRPLRETIFSNLLDNNTGGPIYCHVNDSERNSELSEFVWLAKYSLRLIFC